MIPLQARSVLAKEWRMRRQQNVYHSIYPKLPGIYHSIYPKLPGKSSSKSVSYSELLSLSKMLWNEGEANVVTV